MSELSWAEAIALFGHAIAAALIVGAVAPLVGAFLFVRRTSFYGIALPQVAAAGVACGFVALPWWIRHVGIGELDLESIVSDNHAAMNYHIGWASLFTFASLSVLAALQRRAGSEVARVAGLFAIASALTVLFAHASPHGEQYVHDLLRGEILAIDVHQLETVAALFGGLLLSFVVFHRDLLLVCFDRESAIVLGKRARLIEYGFALAVGLAVSVGTMTVGPMILFGLLVLPPLAARQWARSMTSFYALCCGFGVAAVLGGVWVSFRLDEPWGPSIVTVAALLLAPGAAVRTVRARLE